MLDSKDKIITIKISNYEDWKTQFLEKYCDRLATSTNRIKDSYRNCFFLLKFSDQIALDVSIDNLLADIYFLMEHIKFAYEIPSGKNMNYHLPIREYSDYQTFFTLFVDAGILAEKYRACRFFFHISLPKTQHEKIDELIFFYFFLIVNRYSNDTQFVATVDIDQPLLDFTSSPNFYRLNTYFYLHLIRYGRELFRIRTPKQIDLFGEKIGYDSHEWPIKGLRYVGNLVPALRVDSELLHILQAPITENDWKYISSASEAISRRSIENVYTGKQLNKPKQMLLQLCRHFLFGPLENEGALTKLRTQAFQLQDFINAVYELPFLALVVFSLFDYTYRIDMAAQYKEKVREKNNSRSVTLRSVDFLSELQDRQKSDHYFAHQELLRAGIDNKTLLMAIRSLASVSSFSNDPDENELACHFTLHPNLIGELYESATIAEGLLQLIENVVFHAGVAPNMGVGLLSLHIHRRDRDVAGKRSSARPDDSMDLEVHYPEYFDEQKEIEFNSGLSSPVVSYYLEIKLADLSNTNVPEKFKKNHQEYISSDEASGYRQIFDAFSLKSFFAPSAKENRAWDAFYRKSSHIINHYGLQIFNSIVRSKSGYFYVTSQNSEFCSIENAKKCPTAPKISGTSYTILLPMKSQSSADKNIYDSMLSYNLKDVLISPKPSIVFVYMPNLPDFTSQNQKEDYISSAADSFFVKLTDNAIAVVDISQIASVECLVKSMVFYIYRRAVEEETPTVKFALLNCTTAEIVNIVRLISLFYNRQAESRVMKNVQIYIRGSQIGEEILFYGDSLDEVEHNIAKIACMRGILYENYKVIHDIFRRDDKRGDNPHD